MGGTSDQNMLDDENQAGIKVTLGLLGLTGVLVLVGSIIEHINKITDNLHLT